MLQSFFYTIIDLQDNSLITPDHLGSNVFRLLFYVWVDYDVSCVVHFVNCTSMIEVLSVFASLFGFIMLCVLMCLEGSGGENRFGPAPLLGENTDTV